MRNLFKSKGILLIVYGAIIFLAFLPMYRMISIVLTIGENNLSNDYLIFSDFVIDAIANGVQIKNLGQTCFNAQCEPLTFLIMVFLAKISHWNVSAEILFSIAIAFITAILIYILVAGFVFSKRKIWLLVFILAFTFSFTVISTFTFGQAAIYTTVAFWGLCLGMVGVKFSPNSYKGLITLILGMLISAWSYGAGLLSIPILFAGLLIGFRQKRYYLFWGLSLLLIAVPYYQYFFLDQTTSSSSPAVNLLSFFRWDWIAQLLGYFFSNNIWLPYPGKEFIFSSNPLAFGISGIVFFVFGLLFLIRFYGFRKLYLFYPELSLLAFGLGSAWMISIIRINIAPWYISNGMPFWLGLACLYFSLNQNREIVQTTFPVYVKGVTLGFFLFVSVLFIHSNIKYEDKVLHIMSRAPVSASCLRNYKIAPTYCEGFLFHVFRVGNIQSLAEPLEKYSLSVFSPLQFWILQGDYVFESVQVDSPSAPISWWTGLDGEKSTWQDYKRLDLLLPSPGIISWRIDLTSGVKSAELITAVGVHQNYSDFGYAEDVTFLVTIETLGQEETVVFEQVVSSDIHNWKYIRINLENYIGQEIAINMSVSGSEGMMGAWAMYKSPIVKIQKYNQLLSSDANIQYEPENMELSGNLNSISDKDYNFNLKDMINWETVNMEQEPIEGKPWLPQIGDLIRMKSPVNICLSNYSEIFFEVAQAENVLPRYITLYLETNHGLRIVDLPLLQDANMHLYKYPLRLLETDPYGFLWDIYINPHSFISDIDFGDAGLIHEGHEEEGCDNFYPDLSIRSEGVIGEIYGQISVNQTFVSTCQGIMDRLDVYSATYSRENSSAVLFALSEAESGKVIWKQDIPAALMENNGWKKIDLPPIYDTYNKTYLINFSSPLSSPGDAITFYISYDDQYSLGELNISNIENAYGDLVFRYHCSSN